MSAPSLAGGGRRRRAFVLAAVAGLGGVAGCVAPPQAAPALQPPSAEIRQALAPSGALRVAVYAGSPTSMVRAPGSDEMRGLAVEVGRDLARRLGVPAEIVVFQRVAEVVDALKERRADFTITNATAARAELVDFTPPVVALELGLIVLPGSPVQALADWDRSGVRIGVSQGSTSQGALARQLRQSAVVPAPSLQAAGEMLQRREIDAFATNKGILFEMADRVPGARVVDGRWGLEHLAIAVPKGRAVAQGYLERYAAAASAEGLVRAAAQRAGLRGTAEP